MYRCLSLLATAALALAAANAAAAEVDFGREVQPVLAAKCVRCHGPEKRENGLRLDAGRTILKGGDNGPAVVARKSAESLMILAVTGKTDLVSKMPPKGEPLTEAELALIRRWIDEGATFSSEAVAATKSKHWSFQRLVRPSQPLLRQAAWPAGAIDAFLLARLEKEGLAPSPPAGRPTLIRRAYLDLIGLPPAPDAVDAFVNDERPDAYERVVDQLLASPHYGERWGRHWLDLARYADSNGYTRDFGRQIWKYREWVIAAINRNQPFDEFTIEQLAGDMLPAATQEQLVATGFHRNTLFNEEGGTDPEQFRVEAVVDRVNTTGSVWLGLTVGCARCHTHKYDPLSQVEYYQLFALLNNCDEPTIEAPSSLQRERGELALRDEIRGQIKQLELRLEEERPDLEAAQRAWEATVTPQQRARLPGPVQVAYDMKFEKRDEKNRQLIEEYFRQADVAREQFPLLQEVFELREVEPKIPTTMILRERKEPRETFVHKRGDFLDRGPDVTGGVPAVLPPLQSSGERATRLDFARWLVSAENPLTPRVVVNRDWLQFFGRGLVETEDDFGTQGTPPTHPELLDWLAVEFSRGWDSKALHRRIVTSNVYRQSSAVRSDLSSRDPQNKLLARQARLRLDAEIIRDVALSAAGLLTTQLGGASVFPPQPEGVFDFTQDPKPWLAAKGGDRYRRGMYTHFWRSSPYPMLMAFDAPAANVTCTRRLRSNTPLQSLTLANDQAFYECAAALAERVCTATADPSSRANLAFRLCLSREPTAAEAELLGRLVERETTSTPSDPAAAWTRICRVLLNLDETITRE
ncbi:MAG TPA: PSD1 and planctomycete cytochrome C domain-containing protein [Pirellulaceae bacterium]|nr:PSD1 and planctomycete cytochrome C domain-containing protein [Pirellulaceae bacterium]